jgi:hypothetical protein
MVIFLTASVFSIDFFDAKVMGTIVDWLPPIRALILLLLAGALVYMVLRIWRSKSSSGKRRNGVDFRPSIGFALQDGFKSVALLLANKSRAHVWTEEIEIALTDLSANQQTSEATCREIHKVRQTVSPQDLLPISLVETIYTAAGKPQRKYSCILSSVVRYRVGERWFEEPMPAYRLRMIGLTVAGIRRERKCAYVFKPQDKAQDSRPVGTNTK